MNCKVCKCHVEYPKRKIKDGTLIEMCCDPCHRPHLTYFSGQISFFEKHTKAPIVKKTK